MRPFQGREFLADQSGYDSCLGQVNRFPIHDCQDPTRDGLFIRHINRVTSNVLVLQYCALTKRARSEVQWRTCTGMSACDGLSCRCNMKRRSKLGGVAPGA